MIKIPISPKIYTYIYIPRYYTWVEQQGVTVAEFEERRSQAFWKRLHKMTGKWDQLITEFNKTSGAKVNPGKRYQLNSHK